MESVQREKLYTFTGWHDCDRQRGFLTASGWLGEEGMNDQVRVDLGSNNLRHYALPKEECDPEEAVHATLEFLQLGPRKVTAPLWAAMYAAPLTSLRPLNAVISVYGTTQSGKSTLSHLALTHFGTGHHRLAAVLSGLDPAEDAAGPAGARADRPRPAAAPRPV